jgi:hypothetical protein
MHSLTTGEGVIVRNYLDLIRPVNRRIKSPRRDQGSPLFTPMAAPGPDWTSGWVADTKMVDSG